MANVQGEEADDTGCLSGLVIRLKAKVKSRRPGLPSSPAAGTVTSIKSIAPGISVSSNLCASDSAPPNSIPVAANPNDEPPSDSVSHSSEEDSLWMRAYNAAQPDTKRWIEGFSKRNGFPKSTDSAQAEELVGIVLDIEKHHQNRALRIEVGQKVIFWKDYASRIISFITVIGDIAVQFAPAPSGIVWPALKAVLQICATQCKELAAILGCAEKVLSIMRRGKVYEVLYTDANTRRELREDLVCRLLAVYTKSLDLLAHVGQRLAEGYQHILLAIVNPGKAEGLIAGLIQCENDLALTAQACADARSADADERLNALLSSLSEPLVRIDDGVRDLLEEAEEKEILDALEYFSSINFGDQHRRRAESRTPGTGEWLLQHKKFQEWEQVAASTILWLQGTVGMGKSFLASKVIDRFRVKTRVGYDCDPKGDEGFAFFYCDRGEIDLQNPLSILQSFVRQLSTSPRHSKMMRKSLIKLYRESRKNGTRIGFDACKEQLLESVNLYPQTTLVLDGLDECDAESRDKLIVILTELVKDAERPVKVFISSRREQDIVKLLPARSIIQIDASDNRDDIQRFVEEKMEEMERKGWWESIPETLKSEIKSTLCKGSDGMFRWAYLQMEQLSKCHQAREIKDRLGKLPRSLNASYHELFSQMTSHGQETLQRAVMWVMCARMPLSSSQLLDAVRLSIHADGATLDVELKLAEETLRSICHHLVVKDSQRDKWKFPHASVIEYFEERHKWTMEQAHSFVAKISLLCLIDGYSKWELPTTNDDDQDSQEEPTADQSDPQHPVSHLQRYVRKYWFRHVHALESSQSHDAQLSQLLKCFMGVNGSLQQGSQQYRRWFRHGRNEDGDYSRIYNNNLMPIENPIFGICAFGFYHVLEDWWTAGIDTSQVNRNGRDLLAIAARNEHQHLCEKLIGFGADVSKKLDSRSGGALGEAVDTHNIDMIKCLLDNNADPNIPSRDSILCRGIYSDTVVNRMLLEAKANPDILCGPECRFGSALAHAAYQGSHEQVALLLEYKANVNLYTEGWYGSPLVAAVSGRSVEVARLLVEKGADVNAPLKCGRFGSSLAAAAIHGSVEVARLLIEKGADVNAPLKCGLFGSALAAAGVGWGGIPMVKYLIEEAGADPSILSTNPPLKPPESPSNSGYASRRYLMENGYVVDEDTLRKVGLAPPV